MLPCYDEASKQESKCTKSSDFPHSISCQRSTILDIFLSIPSNSIPNMPATPTATSPAHSSCTIVAPNPKYDYYVSNRWPHSIVKQSYNITGENYAVPINAANVSPAPTPSSSSGSDASSSSFYAPILIFVGIIGLAFLAMILHLLLTYIQRKWRRSAASRAMFSLREKQKIQMLSRLAHFREGLTAYCLSGNAVLQRRRWGILVLVQTQKSSDDQWQSHSVIPPNTNLLLLPCQSQRIS